MERDDNMQQKQEQEEEQWEEMMADLEKYVPFKQQFNEFVASKEKQNERL
jgi:hypothetical protein